MLGPPSVPVEKVVSGGQTGVDRAALEIAAELGIPVGGWCPRGRRAEDGTVPDRYPLQETPSAGYAQRTSWNVRDSDATLVLFRPPLRGGTALTVRQAHRQGRACLQVALGSCADPEPVRDWLVQRRVRILNVAGPRESQAPGVGADARELLRRVLSAG